MIARIWKGWTAPQDEAAYFKILLEKTLGEFEAKQIDGYHGADVLRRDTDDGEVEFMTILWFDNKDVIREFAGADITIAHIPDEARAALSRFDERVTHFNSIKTRFGYIQTT